MTMKISLFALAVGLGTASSVLIFAQESATSAPISSMSSQAVEVTPLAVELPDPKFVADLAEVPMDDARNGRPIGVPRKGMPWQDFFERVIVVDSLGNPSFINHGPEQFMSSHEWKTGLVDPTLTRKQVYDNFVKKNEITWRLRGAHFDCIPRQLASNLQTLIETDTLPAGDRGAWIQWMQKALGIPVNFKEIIVDLNTYRIRPGRTSVESIINGLAHSWAMSAYLNPSDQDLLLVKRPDKATMEPQVETKASVIVYNPPLKGVADQEFTINFQDAQLVDVCKSLEKMTGIPFKIEIINIEDAAPITIRADQMKLRYILEFIGKLTSTGTQIEYAKDHITIVVPKWPQKVSRQVDEHESLPESGHSPKQTDF